MPLPDVERKIIRMIPSTMKPVLRLLYYMVQSTRLYKKIARLARPSKSREELHKYWKQPWDSGNAPQEYLKGERQSQFLVEIVNRYCSPNAKILEIGCNVGRNLNYLFQAGFQNLEGIEISENAVQLLKATYPEMAQHVKIYNDAVEDIIQCFENDSFDLVFTMAVLEHIHPESERIFPEMVRITKKALITIEAEAEVSWGIFPRNYREIFESIGMKQIEGFRIRKLGEFGGIFSGVYFLRVFNIEKE